MRTNSEGRLIALEIGLKWVRDQLRGLADAVAALQALSRIQSAAVYSGGGSGGGGGVFFTYSSVSGASAPPPTGVPGSVVASVFRLSGGAYIFIGTATIYNPYLASTAGALRVLTLAPNGDGTYTVLGESCL